jgi:alkylhydroperoxidase family enzyme
MAARIPPLEPPYDPDVGRTLERMMPPGVDPLKLFRTVAHNPHVLERFRTTGAYILNFGLIPPLEREILIHRTCARCGCEYEWGVHAVVFASAVGLSEEQLEATWNGAWDDAAWSEEQSLLVRLADELHDTGTVSPELWQRLEAGREPAALIELIAICGFYHFVSFMANGTGVEHEEACRRAPQ